MSTAQPSEGLQKTIPSDFSLDAEARVARALRHLLVLLAVAYACMALIWGFDADELQSMTTAIAMAHGDTMYVDVWDNHGPTLYYALAGLVRLFPEHHAVLFPARVSMLVFTLLTAWLVHRLARNVRSDLPFFADLASVVFLMSKIVSTAGYEIRPDVPFMFLWALTLTLFMKATRTGRKRHWLAVGIVLGLGFWFSLKTLLLGVAVGAMLGVVWIAWRRVPWRETLLLGAGATVGPALMGLGLWRLGNLAAFWHSYYGQNTDRGGMEPLDALKKLRGWDPLLAPLLTVSFLLLGWALAHRRVGRRTVLIAVAAFVYLLEYAFLMPTHHPQSALPLMVPGAILIAWGVERLARMHRVRALAAKARLRTARSVSILLVVLVVLHLADAGWYRFNGIRTVLDGEALSRFIGDPNAGIVEGYGLPLYQPRPLRYKVLVMTIGNRSRGGRLPYDFVAETDRLDIPYVQWDKRVHRLGDEYWRFLEANYLPLRRDRVLAAAKLLSTPGMASIRITGLYSWRGPEALRVDGRGAPNPVRLTDGEHRFEWAGGCALILSVAPPEKWATIESIREWLAYGRQPEYNKDNDHIEEMRARIWGGEEGD